MATFADLESQIILNYSTTTKRHGMIYITLIKQFIEKMV